MCFKKIGNLLFLGALCLPLGASAVTFNGATTFQTMDGIGVNVNYRSWEGTNLVPVLNAYIEDAGASMFRLTFDLSDWETENDDTNSNTFNWDYYNPIYSSPEFTRLWEMIEYLNGRGFTNRVCLTFMGWGPAWMMDADGRSLKPGMEDEWAEMIASVLIYARNTRGLQLSLVAPNNEPDIPDEGIQILSSTQYSNTLHRLVTKLDANGVTNLWFVGPDLSKEVNAPNYMSKMLANPTIMSRVKHFGVHTYGPTSAASDAKAYIQANYPAYTNRSVWVTEYNVWCDTCDDGVLPTLSWDYTRGTAEYLLNHLQRDATAALAWEGYDSIYAHHYTNWGFFGLMAVNSTNAGAKIYTPRKNFHTVAQISKWVRPGAKRISVGTHGFTYLTAFKHDALGQVTIVGVNSGGSTTLTGPLTNLPAVSELVLTYTTEFTNQAAGGVTAVTGGNFSIAIPGNSVFTLTGFTAKQLTNGGARTGSNGVAGTLDHYYINITNPVARAQFEVGSLSADVTLIVEKGQPSDGVNFVQYSSANPGTNSEMVILRPDDGPKSLTAGLWYLSVLNVSGTNATYSVKATQWDVSGVPLTVHAFTVDTGEACLEWNSVPGAAYVVEGKLEASAGAWENVSGTLIASGSTNTFCVPLSNPHRFFRVNEGIAVSIP